MKEKAEGKSAVPYLMYLLMAITGILMTITGILSGQSFFRILPLYVSLVVGLLQSKVNRYAPLIGGINSLLYAAVYFYYGLLSSAVYAIVVSCPFQIITFLNWRKRAYGNSVVFKCMTKKQRIVTACAVAAVWTVMYLILSAIGSNYILFDNTLTMFGILITVLTMLAYIEYTWLMIPNCLCSVFLYIAMMLDKPEQIVYLIFSIYSLICNVKAFIAAGKLYAKQKQEQAQLQAQEQAQIQAAEGPRGEA